MFLYSEIDLCMQRLYLEYISFAFLGTLKLKNIQSCVEVFLDEYQDLDMQECLLIPACTEV